ncbi:long-chain-fatty-acid--CoA ligase [Paroceanicella profunda]|uniref:3-methylmercaptopropionyl-CoA ligase n=1 Tax=Paroceanicella profunda TaxID=2579971 RepID=A0A5B8FXC2_9RHOB|nr:long-chain-fatty-acid--CoA ligase [Paroceanicella profunda]QDL92254.1 long-chain-fatty-acid--CoA ligase [Paroceanicella profunda]
MHDLMQDWEMRVTHILDHAARYHAGRRLAGRSAEGDRIDTTYGALRGAALRVTQALRRDGIGRGDVVGVMAWNTPRMMEVWYGVPGAGAVLHTLNPRLFADQLVYIINHAGDTVMMVDADLLPVLEAIADRLPKVRRWIVLTDTARMPATALPAISYEDWLAGTDGDTGWTEGSERDACGICYTSGTTGNPKGVVYTHRSNVLHALTAQARDMFGLASSDTLMPVVPLFHANGWSCAYSAPMSGAAMVMPGRDMSPAGLYEMLSLGVTITAAVPTIWLGLLRYLEENRLDLPHLDRVVIGGSSCPRAVIEAFQERYGVQVLHAWGMTEMSPLGTVCTFKPEVAALGPEARLDTQETVGHPPFMIDLAITDDAGRPLPHDGRTQGRLKARGPAVLRRYLNEEEDALCPEGWFDTGDMATMDAHGYVRITDRSKDVIKSGGEWISSIALENAAVGHPDVAEAAAIGIPHPKWDERPLLVVVPRPGRHPDKRDILDLIATRFARWQVPDDVLFVSEIPHTATGKISKLTLRRQLAEMNYVAPE